ncbi:MAG: bifunctional folylpolyglutamate synthase/dihydrofolate synthase [Acidobacteriota bacterium]|jgi:dihydrofolate synthase/folylpolyglutamate synthase|nr:bifunctional folylpolyglutamate synthase/dihydrofolate synthase [Acidobacteriota bacterium]
MNHRETLEYLNQKGNEVQMMHLGLHRTVAMMEALGNPHTKYPSVHIAGTNGKGSVAAMTETILREAGFVTGMYTSPHLVRVEERIRVGGVPVPPAAFALLATAVRAAEEALLAKEIIDRALTAFEFLTCCAFLRFARQKADIAVIEVGLGGKLDATNVIRPLCSVITNIALDHQQYLGNTIRKIAAEKAGIIKKGVPVISGCGDPAAEEVVRRRANAAGARLLKLGGDLIIQNARMRGGRATMDLQTPARGYANLKLSLAGEFQTRNAALAVAAVETLESFRVSSGDIRRGLSGARWEGRLDEYRAARRTLLDGAHNPAAAAMLRDYLEQRGESEIHMIFGAMRDKNVREAGAILFPLVKHIYLTPLLNTRAATPEDIANMFPEYRERMTICRDMKSALRAAWAKCPPPGLALITGSLYLVGDLLPFVRRSAGK